MHNLANIMNRLSSILPIDQVMVGVDVTSKKRAFEEAGLLFESLHGLNRAMVADSLLDRKSTRLNSSHSQKSRMPSSA